jgi:hypothetical protein
MCGTIESTRMGPVALGLQVPLQLAAGKPMFS